jgi:hypothetical protein
MLFMLPPLVPGLKAGSASDQLYKAEVIVTGRGEEERERGFREGVAEIVLKLTGGYGLKESSKLGPFLSNPGRFIEEFTYEDRMKGIPVHDEQGTRDRPFFLRMTAGAGKMDAALSAEGLTIWRDRPEFEVLLTVRDARGIFLAGSEDPAAPAGSLFGYRVAHLHYDGYEQREVLKSIAARRGLTIRLPPSEFKPSPDSGRMCPLSGHAGAGGCVRLRADLTALPTGRWRLDARSWTLSARAGYAEAPQCFHLTLSGVTYDIGLREAIERAAAWAKNNPLAVYCGTTD